MLLKKRKHWFQLKVELLFSNMFFCPLLRPHHCPDLSCQGQDTKAQVYHLSTRGTEVIAFNSCAMDDSQLLVCPHKLGTFEALGGCLMIWTELRSATRTGEAMNVDGWLVIDLFNIINTWYIITKLNMIIKLNLTRKKMHLHLLYQLSTPAIWGFMILYNEYILSQALIDTLPYCLSFIPNSLLWLNFCLSH